MAENPMTIIDDDMLEALMEEAEKSPRLRTNRNFHRSFSDKCQRFLNAMEPGTQVPVHRHPVKEETLVLLKGKVRVAIYGDGGETISSCVLCREGGRYGVDIPPNVWHGLECLEPSVLLECKPGPFDPDEREELPRASG